MSPAGARSEGIAVICNERGEIVEVLRDGLGLDGLLAPGRAFSSIVDPACAAKAEAFLDILRTRNAAFNWELTVPLGDGRVEALHFAGGAADGGFLVVGATSRSGVSRFYEELVRINNEQATALRAAMKDASLQLRSQVDRDSRHFDELSQLNNELSTTQRELARKNAELGRLNEQKNQFLGMAAHDLRNPLDVILTYSEFLLEDAGQCLTPEAKDFVETIHTSSRFMLDLVEGLLDLAKIESGRLELDLARVELGALVEANAARNRVLAAKRGVDVRYHGPAEPLHLVVDPSKVEQVLNNLIGNAVEVSPPGAAVEVAVEAAGERVEISVRDQGPGLPAAEVERLFQPFERTPAAVRGPARAKGAGLGLAIVQRIVQGHGGEIRVDSAEGQGATLSVLLPRGGVEGAWHESL